MLYATILLTLIIILIISVYKSSTLIHHIDTAALHYFHSIQSKSLDVFFSVITWFGSLWVIAPLYIAITLWLLKNAMFNVTLYISIGFFGAIASTHGLKYIMDKQRPNLYETIGDLPKDPSFPSAHTTQVIVFCTILILVMNTLEFSSKQLLVVSLILIMTLVSLSRLYLQVHFLSDVITGALIALFWSYLSYYLLSQRVNP